MHAKLKTASLLFCLFLAGASVSVRAAQPADGWTLFANNNIAAARAAFTAATAKNPKDIDANHGLALIKWMEDGRDAESNFMEVIKDAPNTPAAFLDWHLLLDDFAEYNMGSNMVSIYNSLAENAAAPPEIRASARLAIAELAMQHGNIAAAVKIYDSQDYIRNWKTIGPFDNVSKSGYKKQFDTEINGIHLDQPESGKNDLNISWKPLPQWQMAGTCSPGSFLGDQASSVYYSATSVSEAADQDVVLWYSPTGASKIWINNKLILNDDLYRTYLGYNGETFAVPLKLNKGNNTILIKSADDDSTTASFLLRFTTSDGVTPVALPANPSNAQGKPEPGQIAPAVPALIDIASKFPANRINLEAIARLQVDYNDYESSLDTITKAISLAPNDGWLQWEQAYILAAAGQTDDYRTALEASIAAQPNNLLAQERYYDDQDTKVPADQRITQIRQLLKAHPRSPLLLDALATAYDDQKLTQQSIDCYLKEYAIANGMSSAEKVSQAYSADERSKDELAFDKKALVLFPGDPTLVDDEADVLQSRGDSAAAIADYYKTLKYDEMPTSAYDNIANVYVDSHQPSKAIEVLSKELALRPEDASVRSRIADIYSDEGHKAAAISFYQQAIELDPSQVDLRDKIRLLGGDKPVIDLVAAIPADPLIAAAKASKAADTGWVHNLLLQGREVAYSDGATDLRCHLVVKILDKSAIPSFSTYELGVETSTSKVSNLHARLIKPTGKIIYPDTDDDSTEVSFPSLDVGDIIDVEYDITDYQSGALAHNFWNGWTFASKGIKSDINQFSLITPKDVNLTITNHGTVPDVTQSTSGNWIIRQWKATNVAALPVEPQSPSGRDINDFIDFTTIASWSTIAQWYSDLAVSACDPDDTIRSKASMLTQGDTTDEQKIEHIVKFVRSIRYQSTPFRLSAYVPTDGKEVIRELYGDCKDKAALLCSLLSSVGIKAQMILLSPRNVGITECLPSPRFDHAIARIDTGSGWQWVDATADQMQYGCLPSSDEGVPALIIDPATTSLTTSPVEPVTDEFETDNIDLNVAADGSVKGTLGCTFGGNLAWIFRSAVQSYGSEQHDQLLQAIVAAMLPNANSDGGEFQCVESPDDPLSLNIKFHSDSYGVAAGSLMLLKLPWDQNTSRTLQAIDGPVARRTPLETSYTRSIGTQIVHITVPPGYTVDSLEKPVKLASKWGECDFTYSADAHGISATRTEHIDVLRIPVSEIPDFAAFLKQIYMQSQKQVVLKSTN